MHEHLKQLALVYAALDKMEDEQLLWKPGDYLWSAPSAQGVSRTPIPSAPLAPATSGAGDAGAAAPGAAQQIKELLADNARLKVELAAKVSEIVGMKHTFKTTLDGLLAALANKK